MDKLDHLGFRGDRDTDLDHDNLGDRAADCFLHGRQDDRRMPAGLLRTEKEIGERNGATDFH